AWHKKEGDKVTVDELLVEIETDKVATEVPSLVAGTLLKILVGEGETVRVGTTLAIIDSGDGAGAGVAAPQAAGATGGPIQGARPVTPVPLAAPAATATPADPTAQQTATPRNRNGHGAPLSPAVRRLLAEHGVDIARIQGTGRHGRVKRNDVLSHLQSREATPAATRAGAEAVPFSALRKRIAEHMVRSKATSAHVLQAIEVDFSGVEAARGALKKAWRERESIPLTYLPFIARAVALVLPEFPHLNAHVAEDSLTVYKAINLCVAIDLDGAGLVAPVIRNVASLRVPEIARAIARLAERARANTLKPDDMTGGTYSLTNNGSFGTFITAPIINQPQAAILSIDGVHRRPWVITDERGERIEIRPVGVLAQSFDHRAVDGACSGAYLRRLKQILESREWLGEFLG
ncbi:MAG: Dihydrolipoamide acetyltransferase component of pyruvate dehydrogenase complex, partial [Gammaproteobacteria bacterium]|nr:Dihydrolipoamide acetyltransferase component of pyruvate dehydrogenase complex [Gammaproteobacteria bacterium]